MSKVKQGLQGCLSAVTNEPMMCRVSSLSRCLEDNNGRAPIPIAYWAMISVTSHRHLPVSPKTSRVLPLPPAGLHFKEDHQSDDPLYIRCVCTALFGLNCIARISSNCRGEAASEDTTELQMPALTVFELLETNAYTN